MKIDLVPVWIQLFPRLRLHFFFFLKRVSVAMVVFLWVRCTVHETYKLLFSTKLSLKMSLIALFTHLKIICYSVFNFYQNKWYPNGPLIGVKIDLVPIWI